MPSQDKLLCILSRELTDFSLPKIGEEFGGRDHTTVIHAHEKISKLAANRYSVATSRLKEFIRIKGLRGMNEFINNKLVTTCDNVNNFPHIIHSLSTCG